MIFAFLILITSVVVSIYTEQAALLFVPISFYLLGLVLIVLLSDKDNKGVYSQQTLPHQIRTGIIRHPGRIRSDYQDRR